MSDISGQLRNEALWFLDISWGFFSFFLFSFFSLISNNEKKSFE